jgi:hypothetical protein
MFWKAMTNPALGGFRQWLAFGVAAGVALYQLQAALRWERQFVVPILRDPTSALATVSHPLPSYTSDALEIARSVIPMGAAVCVSVAEKTVEDLIRYHTAYELFPRPITRCTGSVSKLWSLEVGTTSRLASAHELVLVGRADRAGRESMQITRLAAPERVAIHFGPSRGSSPRLEELSLTTVHGVTLSGVLHGQGFAPGDRLVIDRRYVITTKYVNSERLEFMVPSGLLPPTGSAGVARPPSLLPQTELRTRLTAQ